MPAVADIVAEFDMVDSFVDFYKGNYKIEEECSNIGSDSKLLEGQHLEHNNW